MFRYEYLSDINFLTKIDNTPEKVQQLKLTILNWKDEPITTVEGRSTGGSISVNGASSMRRQGSLTMVAAPELYDITNIDNLLSINKRVAIEIGFKNIWDEYQEYPVIWLPQGVFVLSNATIAKNVTSFTISLTLKDKITLLNGENGGVLPTVIHHHPMIDEAGNEVPSKIRDILYTLLVVYGGLPEEKILIDNVPLRIKNAVRVISSSPVYSTGGYEGGNDFRLWLTKPTGADVHTYYFNENVGYTYTDFVYPAKELISNPGETITSVLDKIKNALGNYEYFFDINGVFRFQEIRNFINEGSALDNWSEALNEKYLVNSQNDIATYRFSDSALLTAVSNAPLYSAIKNDIVVWGMQSETSIPIRYHLMIDYKPTIDTTQSYEGVLYRARNEKTGEDTGPYRFGPLALAQTSSPKLHIIATFEGASSIVLTASSDWRLQEYLQITSQNKQSYFALEVKEELPKLMNIDVAIGAGQAGRTALWACMLEDGRPDVNAATWFLDILDVNEVKSLEWMAISNIGRREKVINDKNVNCLFAPNYQNIILIHADGSQQVGALRKEAIEQGETFIQVASEIWEKLNNQSTLFAAHDMIRSMLHEITGYNESISLTTVPIYHLEPNTRIYVTDPDTGVNGYYILKTFSVPLTVGSTMSSSCQKAIERV